MSLVLNLTKFDEAKQSLSLCLQKVGILHPPAVDLSFHLDVSGSFEDEHRSGLTNALLTRLVPWGLLFDPDQKLDVHTFSNGAASAKHIGSVNAENYHHYVENHIVDRVPGWCGGTDYSYSLEDGLRSFGWIDNQEKKASFFGRLVGQKDQEKREKKRSLVIFVTDGDNSDKDRTIKVLQESEARGDQVYFLFIGVSNQGSKFPFLEKIGDMFSNTGFVGISNLQQFLNKTDDELNQILLDEELLDWFKS